MKMICVKLDWLVSFFKFENGILRLYYFFLVRLELGIEILLEELLLVLKVLFGLILVICMFR